MSIEEGPVEEGLLADVTDGFLADPVAIDLSKHLK